MSVSETPLTAPFALIASQRLADQQLAVVLTSGDGARDELLLIVDPTTRRCQAEYFSQDFEGEGAGEVTIRRLNGHTCVIIAQVVVRGLDLRTEECRVIPFDVAVTWSIDPVLQTLDVAGTALVLGADPSDITQMTAVAGHRFNRFAPILDGTFERKAVAA